MKYQESLKKFSNLHIAVIGDVMLDLFTHGIIERVNPEQPASHLVKAKKAEKEDYVLGGAANVANNLKSLGAKVTLYGCIGNDPEGKIFQDLATNLGITFIPFSMNKDEVVTIVKQRVIAHGQQIIRLDFGEYNERIFSQKHQNLFLEKFKKNIANYDGVIFSDYKKGTFTHYLTQQLISLLKKEGKLIAAASKQEHINFFAGSTLITQNLKEACLTTGQNKKNTEEDMKFYERLGKSLREISQAEHVVVTLSERGVFSYDGRLSYVPTQAREVSDVTGAGDTFIATLTLGLLSGLNLHDSAELANYASGLVVEKVGTATTTLKELAAALERD